MTRFSGRVLWTVAALAIVVAAAQVAEAQREGGRRGRGGGRFGGFGGFGPSRVQLASADEVQAALNLNDEQKGKIEEIRDQLREDLSDLRGGGGGDFRANMEERQKLNQEADAKLVELLDENQQKRLMGIVIQVNGASALLDDAIAKELSVTEDQKSQLSEVRDSNREAAMEAFQDSEDLSGEERMAKFRELRTEGDKKLLAVLTTDQQSQFEALKGEPVEIDMSQFRGRGFGGRGEGRGRGGRDRDRDNDGADNDRGA
jgi:Spy/CpxP family protein refolding chaperone